MILEKLVLRNFRQFYGEQTVFFAEPGPRNVTLIHAENGFGKTALLNALSWSLFGEVTDDFEQAEDIVNQRAVKEQGALAEAKVSLRFHDGDYTFTVSRSLAHGMDRQRSNLTVHLTSNLTGETSTPENPVEVIYGVLPKAMWRHFFFNGERIDHLARNRQARQITEAIKQILGLSLLTQTQSDLRNQVCAGFRDQVAKFGDNDTKQLKKEYDDNESLQTEKENRLKELEKNELALKKRWSAIDEELKKNQATRDLQTQREAAENRLDFLKNDLVTTRDKIARWISSKGMLAFSGLILRSATDILEDKRKRREIPFRYRQSFIEDILHDQRCICDRPLEAGTAPFHAVQRLLKASGNDSLDDAYQEAQGTVATFKQQFETEHEHLTRLTAERVRMENEIRSLGEKVSELARQIDGKERESGTSLEKERSDIESKLKDIYTENGELTAEIRTLKLKAEKISKELEKLSKRRKDADLAGRRLKAAVQTADFIDQLLLLQTAEIREELSNEISRNFSAMCRKDYWAELGNDYILRIRKRVGSDELDVAKSTGENQITSLAFIGSLIHIARQRERRNSGHVLGGGTYPVVMDSPFGSLDDEYREGIATWLPTVAPQVVVLVTGSQWSGVVDKMLAPRVGREFLMVYHGPTPRNQNAMPRIRLHNRDYEQIVRVDESEYTEILEVME